MSRKVKRGVEVNLTLGCNGVKSIHSILLKNPLPVSAALGGGRGWRDPDEVEFGPVQ